MPETMIERVARAIEIAIVEKTMHHPVSKLLPRLKWLWPIVARAAISAMREPIVDALKPFADCAEELDGSEDVPRAPDGEWAKFRLLTDDYRRARDVVAMIGAALAEGQ